MGQMNPQLASNQADPKNPFLNDDDNNNNAGFVDTATFQDGITIKYGQQIISGEFMMASSITTSQLNVVPKHATTASSSSVTSSPKLPPPRPSQPPARPPPRPPAPSAAGTAAASSDLFANFSLSENNQTMQQGVIGVGGGSGGMFVTSASSFGVFGQGHGQQQNNAFVSSSSSSSVQQTFVGGLVLS